MAKLETVVIAKCQVCGFERTIQAGEIQPGDYPMCPRDGMPLIAERATLRKVPVGPEGA